MAGHEAAEAAAIAKTISVLRIFTLINKINGQTNVICADPPHKIYFCFSNRQLSFYNYSKHKYPFQFQKWQFKDSNSVDKQKQTRYDDYRH